MKRAKSIFLWCGELSSSGGVHACRSVSVEGLPYCGFAQKKFEHQSKNTARIRNSNLQILVLMY